MEKCSFALHAWPGGKFNHLPFALNKNRTCKLEIFLDSMYSLAMGVSSDIVLDSETVQVDNSGVMYSLRQNTQKAEIRFWVRCLERVFFREMFENSFNGCKMRIGHVFPFARRIKAQRDTTQRFLIRASLHGKPLRGVASIACLS